MNEWWDSLAGMTQVFYALAVFFSVFFLWQVIGAFLGLDGDSMDADGADSIDIAADEIDYQDVVDSSQAFKLLSLRTIVTFFTLFFWMSALYMSKGTAASMSMVFASIWGLVGMVIVASIVYMMNKMTESGTKDLRTIQGGQGVVYLDIPRDGYGEIKTEVNGASEHIKAKSVVGSELPAGTQVKIVQVMSQTLVGVIKLEEGEG